MEQNTNMPEAVKLYYGANKKEGDALWFSEVIKTKDTLTAGEERDFAHYESISGLYFILKELLRAKLLPGIEFYPGSRQYVSLLV